MPQQPQKNTIFPFVHATSTTKFSIFGTVRYIPNTSGNENNKKVSLRADDCGYLCQIKFVEPKKEVI